MRYPVPSVVTVVLARLRMASRDDDLIPAAPRVRRIVSLDKPIGLKNPPLRRAAHTLERASNM